LAMADLAYHEDSRRSRKALVRTEIQAGRGRAIEAGLLREEPAEGAC
jgi:hypothetical protein